MRWLAGSLVRSKPMAGSDKRLYYEIAQHLTFLGSRRIHYEPSIQQSISPFIQEGCLVFDVGANIGQYALWFSERVGSSGRIIAIEPDYRNFAFLQFNVLINKCSNVYCEPCGLGRSVTTSELYRDAVTGGRRSTFDKALAGSHCKGQTESVPIKTLDHLIQQHGLPQFIKIDAEGAEVDILQGLSIDIERCVFLIEVRAQTVAEVWRYFQGRGYCCLCIEKGREVLRLEEIPPFAHLLLWKKG